MDTCIMDKCIIHMCISHVYQDIYIYASYMHVSGSRIMDTYIMDTCIMDACIMDTCIMATCITSWIHASWTHLCGSHGLSARRARRTKSRRPEGPKGGPKGRRLEVGARRAEHSENSRSREFSWESAWFFLARPWEMFFYFSFSSRNTRLKKGNSRSRLEARDWNKEFLVLVSKNEIFIKISQ